MTDHPISDMQIIREIRKMPRVRNLIFPNPTMEPDDGTTVFNGVKVEIVNEFFEMLEIYQQTGNNLEDALRQLYKHLLERRKQEKW